MSEEEITNTMIPFNQLISLLDILLNSPNLANKEMDKMQAHQVPIKPTSPNILLQYHSYFSLLADIFSLSLEQRQEKNQLKGRQHRACNVYR